MARAPEVRIAGIPVRFEPVFFVIIVLLGLPQELPFVVSWVVVATISVLLHELGHAVAFRAYGLRPSIVLHGFGGLTSGEGALAPGPRIVTSLAGPLSALLLLGVPALVLRSAGVLTAPAAHTILDQVVWINIGWSLLNLLPVLPLDGGQVFLSVCDLVTGDRGRRVAEILSVGVAAIVAVWAFREGFTFGAVLAGGLAAMNLGQLRKVRQDELVDQLSGAHRALLDGRLDDARAELATVGRSRPSGPVRDWWQELDGWAAVLWSEALVTPPVGVPPSPEPPVARPATSLPGTPAGPSVALQSVRALAAGRRDEGVTLAAWALAKEAAAPPKSLLAVALARAGVVGPVATELGLLGEQGREGGRVLRDLLVHLGRPDAAAEVDAALA